MGLGKKICGLAALGVLAIAGVMAFRAYGGGSVRRIMATPAPEINLDLAAAANRLAGAVRFQTISYDDRRDASADAFLALHAYLQKNYPNAHRVMKRETINEYALLYTWPGSDPSLKPIMLMAHQDVVPITPGTEKEWLHPPFSGDIADGFVWGRGAWDDKSNLLGVFEALELLARDGAQPKRTIYVASGHDEEISGQYGAKAIAALLEQRGVKLEFVIDEGSVLGEGLIPGVAAPVAMIGLAEKGSTTLAISSSDTSGHSSMPPKSGAIGAVAKAVAKLEDNQMPAGISGVARETFEAIAPVSSGLNRLLLSNLWLTAPLVRAELEKRPSTNAQIRTTTALTVFNAGSKSNVLPGRAEALVNFRILPGDTAASVMDHARRVIDNPKVEITPFGVAREASPVSPSDSQAYIMLERTISETFPQAVVVPSLVVAGTDSRFMTGLASNIYRFLPVRAKPEDLSRFHGVNERMGVENYGEVIRFFHRLVQQAAIEGK